MISLLSRNLFREKSKKECGLEMPATHENDSISAKRLIQSQNASHGIALTEGFTVNSEVITGASTEVLIHQIVACSTILAWVRRTLVYVYKNNTPYIWDDSK